MPGGNGNSMRLRLAAVRVVIVLSRWNGEYALSDYASPPSHQRSRAPNPRVKDL